MPDERPRLGGRPDSVDAELPSNAGLAAAADGMFRDL
jgi:hypothetical protein